MIRTPKNGIPNIRDEGQSGPISRAEKTRFAVGFFGLDGRGAGKWPEVCCKPEPPGAMRFRAARPVFFREVSMRNRPYGPTLAFIFVSLAAFSCSFRHPVSQIKAQPRVSTGDGAAAAVRMSSGGESGLRTAAAAPAPALEAQQASSGPIV